MATTMYDVIMDLPLLQGISRAQVSALLEKTHLEFINVQAGEVVSRKGAEVNGLLYIIKGRLEVQWTNRKGDVSITFHQGARSLIGARYLFGMYREKPYTLVAVDDVSLLRIEKSQYLALLQTQPIYLLNYLNYLSLRAQQPLQQLMNREDGTLLSLLRHWVETVTPTSATDIKIRVTPAALARYTNVESNLVRRRLFALQRRGLLELGADTIVISSRAGFLGK